MNKKFKKMLTFKIACEHINFVNQQKHRHAFKRNNKMNLIQIRSTIG